MAITDILIDDYRPLLRQNYIEFGPRATGKFLQWFVAKAPADVDTNGYVVDLCLYERAMPES